MAWRTCFPVTFRGKKPNKGSLDEVGAAFEPDGLVPRCEGGRWARYGLSEAIVL